MFRDRFVTWISIVRTCFEGRLDSLFLERILFPVHNLKYSHIVLLLPSFKLFDGGTASKITIWILFLAIENSFNGRIFTYSEAIFIEKHLAQLHIEYTKALILVLHLTDPYDSHHETDELIRFVIIYESAHTSMLKEKWKSTDKLVRLQKSSSETKYNEKYSFIFRTQLEFIILILIVVKKGSYKTEYSR